ncbi:hypothetical protein OAU96_00495 [Planctomycetota bacterium]|nr:hypothetical protein [Planctomycetota bacterium]
MELEVRQTGSTRRIEIKRKSVSPHSWEMKEFKSGTVRQAEGETKGIAQFDLSFSGTNRVTLDPSLQSQGWELKSKDDESNWYTLFRPRERVKASHLKKRNYQKAPAFTNSGGGSITFHCDLESGGEEQATLTISPANLDNDDLVEISKQLSDFFWKTNSPISAQWTRRQEESDAFEGEDTHRLIERAWKGILARPICLEKSSMQLVRPGRPARSAVAKIRQALGRRALEHSPNTEQDWNSSSNRRVLLLLRKYRDILSAKLHEPSTPIDDQLEDNFPNVVDNINAGFDANPTDHNPNQREHLDSLMRVSSGIKEWDRRSKLKLVQIRELRDCVDGWIQDLKARNVRPVESPPRVGMEYRGHRDYRTLEQLIGTPPPSSTLQRLLTFDGRLQENQLRGINSSHEMFELYCLVKLIECFESSLNLVPESPDEVWRFIERTKGEKSNTPLRFTSSDGEIKVNFFKEPRLFRKTASDPLTPDYLVQITVRNDSPQNIVFDAKYCDLSHTQTTGFATLEHIHRSLGTIQKYRSQANAGWYLDVGYTHPVPVTGVFILGAQRGSTAKPNKSSGCGRVEEPPSWEWLGGLPFSDWQSLFDSGKTLNAELAKYLVGQKNSDEIAKLVSELPKHEFGWVPLNPSDTGRSLSRLMMMLLIRFVPEFQHEPNNSDSFVGRCPRCQGTGAERIFWGTKGTGFVATKSMEAYEAYLNKKGDERARQYKIFCNECGFHWNRNYCFDCQTGLTKFVSEFSYMQFHYKTTHDDWMKNPNAPNQVGMYRCPDCGKDLSREKYESNMRTRKR